jgi:YD repeat-containing protein
VTDIRQTLKLNEIILLSNDDIKKNDNLNALYVNNNLLLKSNISSPTSLYNYILSKQQTKIVFDTDYSLCNNTPNSFDINGQTISNQNSGKLTLKGVYTLFKDNLKYNAGYKFDYGNNPNYGATNWDSWGYYKNLNVETLSHFAGTEGNAWNLSKVTTPMGAEINIEYERDNYDNVNGYDIKTTRMGDGVRVSAVKTKDIVSNNTYTTRYIYTKDGLPNGKTSGVCSYEPELARSVGYDISFYDLYDTPGPMIGYSKVTVVQELENGKQGNTVKTEYNYITPKYDMIKVNTLLNTGRIQSCDEFERNWGCLSTGAKGRYGEGYVNVAYEIENQTSLIGNMSSMIHYSSNNIITEQTTYDYFSKYDLPDNIGVVTQACNLVDKTLDFYDVEIDTKSQQYARNYRTSARLIHTISKYIPTVLRSVSSIKNENRSYVRNLAFDYYTGHVTKREVTNTLGETRSELEIPAYNVYARMGSKVDDINNKNMLSQVAANYSYWMKPDPNNPGTTVPAPIKGIVQTWSDSWNYREYKTQSSSYESVGLTNEVWRPYQSYIYKTDINTDGTFKTFSYFDFMSATNTGWEKVKQYTLYDHYSKELETVDLSGVYSSTKKGGLNDEFLIAESGTSNSASFMHSSFEDLKNVAPGNSPAAYYFGGELPLNQGQQVGSVNVPGKGLAKPHTGSYMVQVNPGQFGPIFKATSTSGLEKGKTYRVSVWVHKYSSPNATLVFTLDGKAGIPYNNYQAMGVTDPKAVQVGDWVLLSLTVGVPSNYISAFGPLGTNDFRAYVYNPASSGNVYIDDMRIQPVNSPVIGYVYDQRGLITSTLDNENFATYYTYDAAGRLIKTEKETTGGVKKVSETFYHYGRN